MSSPRSPTVISARWDELAGEIPDELLALFWVIARRDEMATRIEPRPGGNIATLVARAKPDAPSAMPPDRIQDLQRIAGPFTGIRALGGA